MTNTTAPPRDRQQELVLLRLMLGGDRAAAGAFIRRFDEVIELSVRTVYRRAGVVASEDEIRDIVADIWLWLLDNDMRSLRRFEPERQIQIATWIGVLARNKAIDRLRTRRDRYEVVSAAVHLEERAGAVPPPSDEMERQERQRIAARAFDQLCADDRRFLEAWYLDDRPPAELADEFGIAVGTVYSRRFKIQEKLARLVDRMYALRRRPPHAAAVGATAAALH